ncbi:MAG: AraC family transcriptional regulator [Pseudomonadota bacterium]
MLGEILLSVKIDAHSIGVFHAGDAWGFSMPPADATLAVAYSVMGAPCWLLREGRKPALLREGDSVLTLHGSAVALVSSPQQPQVGFVEYWRSQGLPELGATSRRSAPIHFGFAGENRQPRLLTIAYILRDPERSPLLSILPEVIELPDSAGGLLPWLPPIMQLLTEEDIARKPGYLATATHLAELVFTSFLRAYVLSTPATSAGWLRGLTDQRIGKALAAMHSRPAHPWSASALAAQASMSRATFARRFRDMVGQSPIDYLIAWRMQIASHMVLDGHMAIGEIADAAGYRSETAFRKAFRQTFGMAPLHYAKQEKRRRLDTASDATTGQAD